MYHREPRRGSRSERLDVDVPLSQRVVADLNTALLEQFLYALVAERKAVVKPNRVLADADRKTVVVVLTVSHWSLPYRLTCQNPEGFLLVELAPGVTLTKVQANTGAGVHS